MSEHEPGGIANAHSCAMPFMGKLQINTQYTITIDCSPDLGGVSAIAITWIPQDDAPTIPPIVAAIAPGGQWQRNITAPNAQMLFVDINLPEGNAATATITVAQDQTVVVSRSMTEDTDWTFSVMP